MFKFPGEIFFLQDAYRWKENQCVSFPMEEIRKDILNETDEKEVYQYANAQKSSHSIIEGYLSQNNFSWINGILVFM